MRETMEPTRKGKMARNVDVPCYYLPDLLERHGLRRVDYLTVDTEGSELSFVEDFPWAEYDVRVVQIEQLDELRYKAQRGREARITAHMRANGFELQNRFVVQQRDTFDLVYVPKRDFVEALPQGGNVRSASFARCYCLTGRCQHRSSSSTSPRTTWTSARCARWRRRSSASPGRSSSCRTTASSSTASLLIY